MKNLVLKYTQLHGGVDIFRINIGINVESLESIDESIKELEIQLHGQVF